MTSGIDDFMKSVKGSLCNETNTWALRREVVKWSTNIFPLNTYGAILSGKHIFYIKEEGKEEKLVETVKFTHVWKYENKTWKMSRVLSYDDQEVKQNIGKKEIILSDKYLRAFVGNYKAPKTGDVVITIIDGKLNMNARKMRAQFYASSDTSFFIKEAPLTFEFIKNIKGVVVKMIVRKQGVIVEEAIKK